MRIPLIAGNWKMHKNGKEAEEYIEEFKKLYKGTDVRALIAAPYTCLERLVNLTEGTGILIGAQNVHFEPSGAYTGEISIPMLEDIGVDAVIIGHSERRQYFGETDESVNLKLKAVLDTEIFPILCVGESIEIREAGSQEDFVGTQVKKAFEGIDAKKAERVVVAYEPIWAIGTGKTATAKQAGEMCEFIRNVLIDLYSEEVADKIIIQYGGSVKPENISEIMDMCEIDGALVGGASLDPKKFMDIVDF